MLASGPPIASGYRGSRWIATLEDFYGPAEQKNRNRNNKKESTKKKGETAHAATNLRSYLNQRIPKHYADRSNSNNRNQSHRNKWNLTHDRHSRRGSRWLESEATRRFRAQSKQFDTGTKNFIRRIRPSASELIAGIQERNRTWRRAVLVVNNT